MAEPRAHPAAWPQFSPPSGLREEHLQKNSATISALPRGVMPCSRESCSAMTGPMDERARFHPAEMHQRLPEQIPATRFKSNDAARRRALRAGATSQYAPPQAARPAGPQGTSRNWPFAQAQWVGVVTQFRIVKLQRVPVGRL